MSSKGSMAKEVEERRTRITSLMIRSRSNQGQIGVIWSDHQPHGNVQWLPIYRGSYIQKLHDIFFKTVSILDWRRWVRTRKTHGPGKRDLEEKWQSRKIKIVLSNCEVYYQSSHDMKLSSHQVIDTWQTIFVFVEFSREKNNGMGKVRTRLSEVLHQSWGQRSAGGACTHWGVLVTLSPPPLSPLPPPPTTPGMIRNYYAHQALHIEVKSKPHKDWNSGRTFAVTIWLQSHPSTITWHIMTT